MTVVSHRRVAATNPGKHGPRDWKVNFAGVTPTHSEVVFILGMLLLAEDRYAAPHQIGRYMLWQYIDLLLHAKSPERVLEIAEDCRLSVEDSPARRDGAAV